MSGMMAMEDRRFYFSNLQDFTSWDQPHVTSRPVSKWRWLWRQFLCVAGLSKKPQMYYGIDFADGEDATVEVWGFINDSGAFEINRIREVPRTKGPASTSPSPVPRSAEEGNRG